MKMIPKHDWKGLGAVAAVVATVGLLAASCSSFGSTVQQSPGGTPAVAPAPADPWSAILQRTPYPYALALPKPTQTALDGTYTKVEPQVAEHVHCLRCPDYAAEGGIWKLQLDRGVYRVFHESTGWRSLGSFILTKDRGTTGAKDELVLFNDPICPEYVGIYTWELEEGNLILRVVEDTCSIHLRANNLAHLTWLSCEPPSQDTGSAGPWSEPSGCD